MDITPLIPHGRKIITGYGNGGFKINQIEITGSLLLVADQALRWPVQVMAALTLESLEPLLQVEPAVELLLIGTGTQTLPPAVDICHALKAKNIAVDYMDTGAACRTYNVLLAEERRVAAALIAV